MLDTYGRKYIDPLISVVARALIRLGLTATGVTWFAMVIGASAGVWIWVGMSWTALLVFWISGFLDVIDGEMARRGDQATPWGAVLDVTFDRVVELSVIIGLGLAYPDQRLVLLLLTAAIVLGMTVFLVIGAVVANQGVKTFQYQAGLAERTEGFIALTLMILFPSAIFWLGGILTVLILATAGQRLMMARAELNKSIPPIPP